MDATLDDRRERQDLLRRPTLVVVPRLVSHELFAVWLEEVRARLEATRQEGEEIRGRLQKTIAETEAIRQKLRSQRRRSQARAVERSRGPLREIVSRYDPAP